MVNLCVLRVASATTLVLDITLLLVRAHPRAVGISDGLDEWGATVAVADFSPCDRFAAFDSGLEDHSLSQPLDKRR